MAATPTLPATLTDLTAVEVFDSEGKRLEQILAEIETHARALVPDVSTAKGRKEIASTANKVARSKTYLDGLGKDFVAGLKAQAGQVDARRRHLRERLDALKTEVRRPLTELEEAEAARQQRIRELLDRWKHERDNAERISPSATNKASIAAEIDRISALEVHPDLEDKQSEAQQLKEAILYRLGEKLKQALEMEAEEQRRAAEAEAERQAEREAYAQQAAEKAKREAEQAARLELERERQRAEREKQEAEKAAQAEIERARREAEERTRRELEAQQQETQAKADLETRRRTHQAAAAALVSHGNISEDSAKTIIRAIVAGKIPGVRIDYRETEQAQPQAA